MPPTSFAYLNREKTGLSNVMSPENVELDSKFMVNKEIKEPGIPPYRPPGKFKRPGFHW